MGRNAYFVREDEWGRPVFRAALGPFYCLVDVLCSEGQPPAQETIDRHGVYVKNGGPESEPSHRVHGVRLLAERPQGGRNG